MLSLLARSTRLFAGGIGLAAIVAGCTIAAAETQPGDDEPTTAATLIDQPDADPETETKTVSSDPMTRPVASVPAPEPAPAEDARQPVPDEVPVLRPELLVEPSAATTSAVMYEALAVDGVEHMSGLSRFEATLVTEGEDVPVTVVAVDPWSFRPLTPSVTALTPAVWERLLDGDVLVRHDVAYRSGLELGSSYPLAGPEGSASVRVGAFASNGAPPIADVVIPWQLGNTLGDGNVNLLLAAVGDDADVSQVRDRFREVFEDGSVEVRSELETQQARLVSSAGRIQIEPFTYTDLGDGLIVIDRAWVNKWIVSVDLPYLGRAQVHRLMVYQLTQALHQIGNEGLAVHFDRSQFAGVWVPRHIDWDPRRSLSMHAWGLAIDINSRDNCLGCTPQMHPRIVEIFRSWGFNWGGDWSRPDGMHFEFARYIAPPA